MAAFYGRQRRPEASCRFRDTPGKQQPGVPPFKVRLDSPTAVTVLSCAQLSLEAERMSKKDHKPIRVAVIGCGSIGQIMHLPHVTQLSETFELAAICDLSTGV